MSLAQEEAQRFNHNYIGAEHILLGLVEETEGVAARVLSNLAVDLGKVRPAVMFIIGRGEKPPQGEIGLAPRAKKVVELAVDEARRMNHTHIGTEHLLIGLVREGEGVAAGVLEELGITLDKVRIAIARIPERERQESGQGTALEVEPDLVSLAKHLVVLQQDAEKIEFGMQIAELQEIKGTLDTLEYERQAKEQEIRETIEKLRALLQEIEPK